MMESNLKKRAEAEAMADSIIENGVWISAVIAVIACMAYTAFALFSDSTPWPLGSGWTDSDGYLDLVSVALSAAASVALLIGGVAWISALFAIGGLLLLLSKLGIGYAGLWIKKTLEDKGMMKEKKPKFVLSDVFPTEKDLIVAAWGNDEPIGLIGTKTKDGWDLIEFSKGQIRNVVKDTEKACDIVDTAVGMIEIYAERHNIK